MARKKKMTLEEKVDLLLERTSDEQRSKSMIYATHNGGGQAQIAMLKQAGFITEEKLDEAVNRINNSIEKTLIKWFGAGNKGDAKFNALTLRFFGGIFNRLWSFISKHIYKIILAKLAGVIVLGLLLSVGYFFGFIDTQSVLEFLELEIIE